MKILCAPEKLFFLISISKNLREREGPERNRKTAWSKIKEKKKRNILTIHH